MQVLNIPLLQAGHAPAHDKLTWVTNELEFQQALNTPTRRRETFKIGRELSCVRIGALRFVMI